MALRIRRGTELERLTVVFAEGEIVYATDTKRLYVGDGVTAGGIAAADLLTDSSPQLGNTLDLNSHDIIGFGNINIQGDITATGTLTVPTIITDVQGSIFGDDSTPLVDGANNKLILNNNSIHDLGDVTPNHVFLDQILIWSGSDWSGVDYTLGALTNVDTVGIQNTQIIQWDAQNGSWLPINYSLASLTDVNFTGGLAEGKTIKYNQVSQSWLPTDFKLSSLDDVNIQFISNGEFLKYNGSEFVPSALNLSINDLNDVIIDTPTITLGDTLQWNGSEFIAAAIPQPITSISDLADTNFLDLQIGETIIWDGFEWVNGAGPGDIFETDIQGSVYGLDSSILVDAITNTINVQRLNAIGDTFTLQSNNDVEANFNFTHDIDQEGGRTRIYMTRSSSTDLSTNFSVAGSFEVIDSGSNGNITHNKILFSKERGVWFVTPDGDYSTTDACITIYSPNGVDVTRQGRLGVGTYIPAEKLDVRGNITTTGFVQFGRYTTLERDDLTTTNTPQYATNWGMVIYNTDTNTFQGWANVGGNTPTWVDLS